MLTVREAALRACVSENLIDQWCQDGMLPHYREGEEVRIAVEDLDGVLARFTVNTREGER